MPDLSIKIKAEADDAEKALNDLSRKLKVVSDALQNAFGAEGLKEISAASQQASESMKDVSAQAKSASSSIGKSMEQAKAPIEKVKKSAEELSKIFSEKYKDLGKDFQFHGTSDAAQKQIEKYSNALENAKLKKQALETGGKVDSQAYEDAIRDIQKYSNMIEAVQSQVSKTKEFVPQWSSQEEFDVWYANLHKVEEEIPAVEESFEQVKVPIQEIDMTLANFSQTATQAFTEPTAESSRFSDSLGKLKEVGYSIQERFLELKGRLENTFVQSGLKSYTQEYVELQNQITKTEKTLATLNAQLARGRATNAKFESTTTYRKMQYDIEQTTQKLKDLYNEQDKLELSGGATQWNIGGSDAVKSLESNLRSLQSTLSKVGSKIAAFGKKILSIVSPARLARKALSGLSGTSESLTKSLFKTTKMLKLMVVRMALRGIIDGVKTGFQNLAQYSDSVNASMSLLMNSLNQLKNSFAAAVSPLLNAFAPALNYIIQLCIKAANAVNQLLSALTGKTTWTRAKELTDDYRDSIASAAKTAKGALQPFDALNNLTTQDSSGTSAADMFEEVPIDSKWLDIADKIKDILSDLFAPLKKAWNKVGKYVMDSWKYALKEVWDLIKSIGKDFLTVWNQDATVKMFEEILHIIGDIGQIVGNLAHNFRLAWEENKTGLHILENIRDIIAVVIHNIHEAVEATVEWSKNIDFSPLLTKIEEWTRSLIPVFDALSGVITDFYTEVLLPLGKWVLEKGLPDLLQVFIDFNEKVDWSALRESLSEFWQHLEPFAETVGEGLIIFIDRVSDALADFVNSEAFDNFLKAIEDWMDSVDAEDVANALELIVGALIGLKVALLGYSAISAVTGVLTTIKAFLSFFGASGGAAASAGGMETTAASCSLLSTAITGLIAAAAGYVELEFLKDKIYDLADALNYNSTQTELMSDRYEGLSGDFQAFKDLITSAKNGLEGYGFAADTVTGQGVALEKAMSNISDGAIYTDEQFEQLRERFSLTNDDMEMLRQTTLDTNPLLGEMADTFGLYDATPQTLRDIANGFSEIETNGKLSKDVLAGMTDEAQQFFSQATIDGMDSYIQKLKDIDTEAENTNQGLEIMSDNIAYGITKGMENADTDGASEGFFTRLCNSISSVFDMHSPSKNMMPYGQNILLGVLEGFKEKFSEIGNLVQSFASNMTSKFTSIVSNFKTIGTNLMSGLLSGISSGAQTVLNTVSNIASNITNKFKSVLQIHSPSKVFESLGDYTMEGYKIGLEGLYGDVENSLQQFSLDIQKPQMQLANTMYSTYDVALAGVPNYSSNSYVDNSYVNDSAETNNLLKQLISAVQDGKVIEMDGTQLGKTLSKQDGEYYKRTGRGMFQH